MKKIVILCIASFILLTGCNGNTFTQSSGIETPISTQKTTEETSLENDNNSVNFDASDLYGTWSSNKGTPIHFNIDGTAESISANMKGDYTINGNTLKIYWSKTDRTEIWKIKESDGKITLEYGEAPLVAIYEKE